MSLEDTPAAPRLDDRRLRRRGGQGRLHGAGVGQLSRSGRRHAAGRRQAGLRAGRRAAGRRQRHGRHRQGCRRRSRRHAWRAGRGDRAPRRAGRRRRRSRPARGRHGDAARPADPARRAGDQPGAASDDRPGDRRGRSGGDTDFEVEISVADGEGSPTRTLNGRLGIVGGLSILGTTGIVIPYSCSAWIALDPSRHRRGARQRARPRRRRHRQHVGGRSAEAPRPARGAR